MVQRLSHSTMSSCAPLVAIDELRPRRVLHQVVDQRLALLVRHADEARDLLADIERLAAGLGMDAHDRLGDRRIELRLLLLAIGVRIVDLARAGMDAVQVGSIIFFMPSDSAS